MKASAASAKDALQTNASAVDSTIGRTNTGHDITYEHPMPNSLQEQEERSQSARQQPDSKLRRASTYHVMRSSMSSRGSNHSIMSTPEVQQQQRRYSSSSDGSDRDFPACDQGSAPDPYTAASDSAAGEGKGKGSSKTVQLVHVDSVPYEVVSRPRQATTTPVVVLPTPTPAADAGAHTHRHGDEDGDGNGYDDDDHIVYKKEDNLLGYKPIVDISVPLDLSNVQAKVNSFRPRAHADRHGGVPCRYAHVAHAHGCRGRGRPDLQASAQSPYCIHVKHSQQLLRWSQPPGAGGHDQAGGTHPRSMAY